MALEEHYADVPIRISVATGDLVLMAAKDDNSVWPIIAGVAADDVVSVAVVLNPDAPNAAGTLGALYMQRVDRHGGSATQTLTVEAAKLVVVELITGAAVNHIARLVPFRA